MGAEDEFAQAIEIVSGLYYFLTVKRADSPRYSPIAQSNIYYCIDDELLYEPFFADFGPLNLGRTYRFCQKTKQLLQEAERNGKRVYLYTGPHAHQKANAAVLVGIYQVIYLNRTADVAYKPLSVYKPYVPFRDASCGVSTFHLTVYDVIRGLQRARDVGFIDWNSGSSTWSLEEYEYYEQVENGDLNWIVPGKFVAFSGPAARSNEVAGYRLHTPEDYWDYFRRKGVTTVIRLNKKVYDRKRFLDGGFKHHELYFPDGSCPTEPIIQRFLDTVETEPGAIAVHCKAGLGRTGLLICLYIMKHYRFTAEEVIGYIRVCRPGSVIGPQQNFLREMEARMWHEGELYRAARGLPKAGPAVSDLVVAGRAAGASDLVASPTPLAGADVGGNGGVSSGAVAGGVVAISGRNGYQGGSAYSQMRSSNSGGGGAGRSNGGAAASFLMGASSAPAGASPASADMSLLQYSKLQQFTSGPVQYSGAVGGGGVSYLAASPDYGAGPSSSPAVLGVGMSAAAITGSYGAVSSFRSRYNGNAAGYGSSNGGAMAVGVGRSMTPLRYSQQSNVGYPLSINNHHSNHTGSPGGPFGLVHHSSSHPGPLQAAATVGSRGSLGISSVARSITVPPAASAAAGGTVVGSAAGRSPPTGRLSVAAGLAAPPTSSAAVALRSTLHTDTLAAADRPKLVPERNTQSADVGSGFGLGGTSLTPSGAGASASPWRIAVPSGGGTGPSSGPGTPNSIGSAAGSIGAGGGVLNRPPSLNNRSGGGAGSSGAPVIAGSASGGVARILAPNGQPRKVPMALLNQYAQQQQQPQQQQQGAGQQSAGGGWGPGAGAPGAGMQKSPSAAAAPAQMRTNYSYGLRQ